ncbi:MAG: hypothetical protein LBN23_05050 [Paludibacter sp.]|jgi:ATP-dependent exoDNAse (exonuclease V) beta subunit|nr:hypothetical protein [Paludibacter sp.]
MTVHKSKGLEFQVVIMPFGDWKMEKKSNFQVRNILWCNTPKSPFNELSLLPLEYSAELKNSVFAADYFDEMLHQYIDTLNVAYVAFTRAASELYVFSPAPKTNKDGERKSNENSLGGLLYDAFQNQKIFDDYVSADNLIFTKGKLPEYQHIKSEKPTIPEKMPYYTASNENRLRIRHHVLDFWNEEQDLTSDRRSYGLVMHDILKNISHRADEQRAIADMQRAGRINAKEAKEITTEFSRFWALPHTAEWFADDVKALNESTILTPDGEHYRPDRVILQNNSAIVIDYKFGIHRLPKYLTQVRNYKKLLASMGYNTEGFLCYVDLGEVESV